MNLNYLLYRFKYVFSRSLPLSTPVDVTLELSSKCNMKCHYCLDPESLVLNSQLQWIKIKELIEGSKVVAFDEFSGPNEKNRELKYATIEKKWVTRKKATKIKTEDGEFICSEDHKFLNRLGRWIEAKKFKIGDKILFAKSPWTAPNINDNYMIGYLRGISDGDATARWEPLPGSTGKTNDSRRMVWWRLALTDFCALDRVIEYLNYFNISHPGLRPFPKTKESYKDLQKIEIRDQKNLSKLRNLIMNHQLNDSLDYQKGYLAGLFDSEGSYSRVIRISQKKPNGIIDTAMAYLKNLGFDSVKESSGLRLRGRVWDCIRFLGTTEPAIFRKYESWIDTAIVHKKSKITSIEHIGERDLIDIQTSTKTFYAQGFPTHNCYHAKPKEITFSRGLMPGETAEKIISEAARCNVHSLKFNWKGEPTLNTEIYSISHFAKSLAKGSRFIDRIINSNFKFNSDRDDIFEALKMMTKVKVSFDSFNANVFEEQRDRGSHGKILDNIDKFYHMKNRDNILVIQAVRTALNKDEDIKTMAERFWPKALVSIRDMVSGRVDSDLSHIETKKRSFDERTACIQAFSRLIFNIDGSAFPCCPDTKEEACLGNINELSMRVIWNGDKAKRLRENLTNGLAFNFEPCKSCSSFESFKGYKANFHS